MTTLAPKADRRPISHAFMVPVVRELAPHLRSTTYENDFAPPAQGDPTFEIKPGHEEHRVEFISVVAGFEAIKGTQLARTPLEQPPLY
jgi:hypothetical protein